jgi:hypothetical protein
LQRRTQSFSTFKFSQLFAEHIILLLKNKPHIKNKKRTDFTFEY